MIGLYSISCDLFYHSFKFIIYIVVNKRTYGKLQDKEHFCLVATEVAMQQKIAYSPLTNLLPVESNVPINVCFYYILKCSNGEVRPHEGYLRFINLQECTSKTKKEISLWRIENIFFLFVLHL